MVSLHRYKKKYLPKHIHLIQRQIKHLSHFLSLSSYKLCVSIVCRQTYKHHLPDCHIRIINFAHNLIKKLRYRHHPTQDFGMFWKTGVHLVDSRNESIDRIFLRHLDLELEFKMYCKIKNKNQLAPTLYSVSFLTLL